MVKIRFLQLEFDVKQETDQLICSMQNQPERFGKYAGSYVLGPDYIVVPVLVVHGLDGNTNIKDDTHLIIVTSPKAQKKTQKCSPFDKDYIATIFKNFVLPENSHLGYKPPESLFPELNVKIYIPEAEDGYMYVPSDMDCEQDELNSWKLSGFLALHRENDQGSFKEQVLKFDPEVIIDTGC